MTTRNIFSQKIKPNPNQSNILVDPVYNPTGKTITSKTELARGITIAKFLGGRGDGASLNHITKDEDRAQLARNLYVHAQAMILVNQDEAEFGGYRLVVDEGIYKPGPTETPTADSINDLAQNGRAIAYKLYNERGQVDIPVQFDLAVYWKDSILYEKIICDYDKFNPDGSIDFQIILVVPNISSTFTGNFSKKLETRYNGKVQSANELIEILE